MSTEPGRHSADVAEALEAKSAPERYRAEIRHRRGWLWEVDLATTHYLPIVGERGEPVEALLSPSRLMAPYVVLGERWANWKGRRLIAAAKRADVREGQPWAVVQ